MARRSKASRGAPTPVRSPPTTPIPSTLTTPLSSAYPSTYPSEDEDDGAADAEEPNREPEPEQPTKGFRFLDLPPELRLRIYDYHFADCRGVTDLEPENYKRIGKKLVLLLVCKQLYHEVTPFFFGNSTFRVFPIHPGRPLKTKKPLLARLTPNQRAWITNLELRLGPGFNNPPRGWVINDALGLRDCVRVKKLRVYVEIDPSDNALKGFRRADGFYEEFSSRLLTGILAAVPSVEVVEFDAWPSVKISGGMMQRLLSVISPSYQLAWGPDRGWNGATTGPESHDSDAGIVGFEKLALVDYIPA
ncbi:uncharacterized protein DNG_05248 [Cephalotrichum gorgonifer]|uniref:Uncharacterized protein n=1 Tax=Cephalotrichum gorgonifer TaxID=2041049 RepID=A0AAE8N0D9_9PEZI|nr:uncharacterized protein DNG_05248 [Cephalotrichum gorgonifer]